MAPLLLSIKERIDQMKLYVVLRDEGIRSDGYYYESDTTVLGVFNNHKKASEALVAAADNFHPNEKPVLGSYNIDTLETTRREYELNSELNDIFWIEETELNQSEFINDGGATT